MRIVGPLKDATFIERPNRFLTIVQINGKRVKSHLPDPGRLKELLIPGVHVKVRSVSNQKVNKRKTNWTTVMVRKEKQWISIDSTLPNRFVRLLLENQELPMFFDYDLVRSEVKHGHHRYDFLLKRNNQLLYLEVKSVTLVKDGVAMFPDAVTVRGARHMAGLADLLEENIQAGVLFVCQRSDISLFRPEWNRDPSFANALKRAVNLGVKIWIISTEVNPISIRFKKEVPYDLSP